MPLVRIQTNISLDDSVKDNLMRSISFNVSEILQKPESYMMIIIEPDVSMTMSILSDPTAFIEVRSVGALTPEDAANLSGKLSEIMGVEAGVGAGRIYVNCFGVPGDMWGFDGRTFS